MKERLPALERELSRVVNSVAQAWPVADDAGAGTTSESPVVDVSTLQAELADLEELLRNDDFDAQKKLEALLPKVKGTPLEDRFERLASALAKYDFEAALKELLEG